MNPQGMTQRTAIMQRQAAQGGMSGGNPQQRCPQSQQMPQQGGGWRLQDKIQDFVGPANRPNANQSSPQGQMGNQGPNNNNGNTTATTLRRTGIPPQRKPPPNIRSGSRRARPAAPTTASVRGPTRRARQSRNGRTGHSAGRRRSTTSARRLRSRRPTAGPIPRPAVRGPRTARSRPTPA